MKTLCHAATLGLAVVLSLALGVISTPQLATAEWRPKKPVEVIIMAGPGGGADKMARLMQSVIEKHKFASKPFIPKNKPGGTGAEALRYLKDRHGDNHVIMVTLNSFYTTPLRQPNLGVDISTYAPIARMAEDTFLLWVHSDTPIKTVDEFVKAAKSAGATGSWPVPARPLRTTCSPTFSTRPTA